jgi:hypothetical protein
MSRWIAVWLGQVNRSTRMLAAALPWRERSSTYTRKVLARWNRSRGSRLAGPFTGMRIARVFVTGILCVFFRCGDRSEPESSGATGGTLATGGVTATGGAEATGGIVATGGAAGTGGFEATGDTEATGGAAGSGGGGEGCAPTIIGPPVPESILSALPGTGPDYVSKYIDCYGLPVMTSAAVTDLAILRDRDQVEAMLRKINREPELRSILTTMIEPGPAASLLGISESIDMI